MKLQLTEVWDFMSLMQEHQADWGDSRSAFLTQFCERIMVATLKCHVIIYMSILYLLFNLSKCSLKRGDSLKKLQN